MLSVGSRVGVKKVKNILGCGKVWSQWGAGAGSCKLARTIVCTSSSLYIQWFHTGSLKSAEIGIFTTTLRITAKQALSFLLQRAAVKHLLCHCMKHEEDGRLLQMKLESYSQVRLWRNLCVKHRHLNFLATERFGKGKHMTWLAQYLLAGALQQ